MPPPLPASLPLRRPSVIPHKRTDDLNAFTDLSRVFQNAPSKSSFLKYIRRWHNCMPWLHVPYNDCANDQYSISRWRELQFFPIYISKGLSVRKRCAVDCSEPLVNTLFQLPWLSQAFSPFREQCGKSGGEGPRTRGGPRFSSVPQRAWCEDKNCDAQ